MKWSRKDPYLKAGITVFATGAALMGLYRLFYAVDDLWRSAGHMAETVISALTPFILAILLAYVLRPVKNALANGLKKLLPKAREGGIQVTALTVTVVVFLAALTAAIAVLLPLLWRNLVDLAAQTSGYFTRAEALLRRIQEAVPLVNQVDLNLDQLEAQVVKGLQDFINEEGNLGQTAGFVAGHLMATVGGFFNGLVTFLLATVLCVYLLKSGRTLAGDVRGFLTRQLGETRTAELSALAREIDRVFGQYIGGKMLQSLIMLLFILPLFLALRVPYAPLMAAVVALTNLIPYVGPFIGGILPVFLTLLFSPLRALLALIAVVLVQQLDNYWIEPRLIGSRLGMHPFWVISCVILGGKLLGLAGILLAVPLAGVIRILMIRLFERREGRRTAGEKQ